VDRDVRESPVLVAELERGDLCSDRADEEQDPTGGPPKFIAETAIPPAPGQGSPQPRFEGLRVERTIWLLDLVPDAPTPVWGRDELDAGEMWNSNSLISWLIVRSGVDTETIQPPAGGRAPGWNAGLVVAHRQKIRADSLRRDTSPAEEPGVSHQAASG
jgi:hypothetical protein